MLPGASYVGHPSSKAAETPGFQICCSFRNAIVLPPPASLGIDANFSLWSLTHSLLLPDSEGDLGFLKPLAVGNCGGHRLTPILVGLEGQGWRKEQRGKFNCLFKHLHLKSESIVCFVTAWAGLTRLLRSLLVNHQPPEFMSANYGGLSLRQHIQ